MGQSSSTSDISPVSALERRRSFRNLKFPSLQPIRKFRKQKRSLSATFTLFDRDESSKELININTATEEELMTLPLVTRDIAHNIVEHRNIIGTFKRVDDLALVSGIGAEKLLKLRGEICVGRVDNVSTSAASSSSSSTTSQELYLDLNSANMFDLLNIAGITQEMAASILFYREKKGRFKSVDELKKVKGITTLLFSVLRSHFVVNESNNNDYDCDKFRTDDLISTNSCDISKTSQLQVKNNNPPLDDIFDLLSAYSHRPVVDDFYFVRHGRKAFRIGTWNLTNLTLEKALNPGFIETCCRTILENRFSILAIQEVESQGALDIICDELNNPKLRRNIDWQEKYHKNTKYIYKNVYLNNLGYIYLSLNDLVVDFMSYQALTNDREAIDQNDAISLIVRMKVESLYLTFVNIKVMQKTSHNSILNEILTNLLDSDNVIILGDFTGLQKPINGHSLNYLTILPTTKETNSRISVMKSPDCEDSTSNVFFDNIMLSKGLNSLYTRFYGMVKRGLTHLAIPNGWTWGGVASEHCPVWCELYVNNNIPDIDETDANSDDSGTDD